MAGWLSDLTQATPELQRIRSYDAPYLSITLYNFKQVARL